MSCPEIYKAYGVYRCKVSYDLSLSLVVFLVMTTCAILCTVVAVLTWTFTLLSADKITGVQTSLIIFALLFFSTMVYAGMLAVRAVFGSAVLHQKHSVVDTNANAANVIIPTGPFNLIDAESDDAADYEAGLGADIGNSLQHSERPSADNQQQKKEDERRSVAVSH